MSSDQLRECLSKQLDEFRMLQSIYSLPGEFNSDNHKLPNEIEEYLDGKRDEINEKLDIRLRLTLSDTTKIELSVTFPQFYPLLEQPIFTIRTASLTRQQETVIKSSIKEFIKSDDVCKDETYVYQVITWLEGKIDEIIGQPAKNDLEDDEKNKTESMERHWIWSHHIYSKIKRQNIMKLTRNNDISGFMWPGKPGVICLEGTMSNVKDVSREIKSWQWQKIKTVKIESFSALVEDRKFGAFEEIVISESDDGGEDEKMNTANFFKYLENHASGYMKKELFGFDQ